MFHSEWYLLVIQLFATETMAHFQKMFLMMIYLLKEWRDLPWLPKKLHQKHHTGWWLSLPPWKMMEFVSWDDFPFPTVSGKSCHPFMFQSAPTSTGYHPFFAPNIHQTPSCASSSWMALSCWIMPPTSGPWWQPWIWETTVRSDKRTFFGSTGTCLGMNCEPFGTSMISTIEVWRSAIAIAYNCLFVDEWRNNGLTLLFRINELYWTNGGVTKSKTNQHESWGYRCGYGLNCPTSWENDDQPQSTPKKS